jgi:hypothetical protein
MTSTLSPSDTGDIAVGERTKNLSAIAHLIARPAPFRRPDATGEIPVYNPKTIAVVDAVTEVMPVPAPPFPTVADEAGWCAAENAGPFAEVVPQPFEVAPPRYRGDHRKADPWWALMLIGAGLLALVEFVGLILLAVLR